MDYAILGPLEIRDDGRLRPIPGIKERALLGLLIVEAGTVVSLDRMIYELWGDEPPATAVRTLRSHMSRLRRALGDDSAVVTRRPGYLFTAQPAEIDAARFETLTDRATRDLGHDPASAERAAAEGLALWRGRPLDDLVGFPFADAEGHRLEERRLAALATHIDASLRLKQHDRVLAQLTALVKVHPFHERFWAQLMLALHRSGRTGDALRAYGDASTALGESLGIEPSSELRALERAIVMDDPALQPAIGLPQHNLPAAVSSFIGRERELGALATGLERSRLVTLTGPGGCGKSRLAVEAAGRLLGRFPDGIWRTELASLRDPEAVPVAVSSSLGEPASHAADPKESLARFLQDRELLIVLDNCEHLLDVCADLATFLLTRCPGVRVLATSREPLRVAGETVWLVPPLQLPDPADTPAHQESAEAFRLFVERSTAALADFEVDDGTRPEVTEICRTLAGLPLAIELAASRARVFTPAELAARLARGLDALTGSGRSGPARHRTMRAAIDWSVHTLEPQRRDHFASLAVFGGGWTLEDANGVLGEGEPSESGIADAISDLVERSLVHVDRAGGHTRYRLLEPIREFALELLEERPDSFAIRSHHATHYLALAEKADAALRGPDQQEWLRRIEADHDNIRAGLRWAIGRDEHAVALRLVAAMGWFWFMAGHWRDAWQWLDESLDVRGTAHEAERAIAITKTGGIQVIRRNDEPVLSWLPSVLEDSRRLGDRVSEAWCFHLIGHSQLGSPTRQTLSMLQEARQIFAAADRPWEVAWSDRYIGDAHAGLGDEALGIETQLASIAAFRDFGDRWSTAYGFHNLAAALLFSPQHGPTAARPYYERCRRLAEEIGDPVWTAHGVLGTALCDFLIGTDDPLPMLADAEDRLRLIGDDNCLITATGFLGRTKERNGDDAAAAAHYVEAARISQRIGKALGIAINLGRIAGLADRHGDRPAARRLVDAIEHAVSTGRVTLGPLYGPEHEELLETVGSDSGRHEDLERLLGFAAGVVEDITSVSSRSEAGSRPV